MGLIDCGADTIPGCFGDFLFLKLGALNKFYDEWAFRKTGLQRVSNR